MRAIATFLFCISIILSGVSCTDSKEKMTGKWINDYDPNNISILELFSDNTFVSEKTNETGKWTKLDDRRIKLEQMMLGSMVVFIGTIEGDKIIIEHQGKKHIFKKME